MKQFIFVYTLIYLITSCHSSSTQENPEHKPDEGVSVPIFSGVNLKNTYARDLEWKDSALQNNEMFSTCYTNFSQKDRDAYFQLLLSGVLNKITTQNFHEFPSYYLDFSNNLFDTSKPKNWIHFGDVTIENNPEHQFHEETDGSFSESGVRITRDRKLYYLRRQPNWNEHPTTERPTELFDPEKLAIKLYALENWNFSSATGIFTKEIYLKGFAGLIFNQEEPIGYSLKLMVTNQMNQSGDWKLFKKDIVYDACITSSMQIFLQYKTKSDPDIPNLMTSFDLLFNIPEWPRLHFLHEINNYMLKHPEEIFALQTNKPDAAPVLSKPLSKDALVKALTIRDTLFPKSIPDGVMYSTLTPAPVTYRDIWGFRFYENWYFDQKTFSLRKEVKGISLLFNTKQNGNNKFKQESGIYLRFKNQ